MAKGSGMTNRNVMGGTLALAALTVVLVMFTAAPGARAADGDPMLVGHPNFATSVTALVDNTIGGQALQVNVDGNSSNAIFGWGGTDGTNGVGLFGLSGFGASGDYFNWLGSGVFGKGSVNGVSGETSSGTGSGVFGQNDATGYGVTGRALGTTGGTGVYGDAPNSAQGVGVEADSASGIGLQVKGKAVFSRSGIAVVSSGQTSVTVTMSGVTTSSMILATVQQSGGFYVKYAVPASGSFKIVISKAATSTVKVAFFVLN